MASSPVCGSPARMTLGLLTRPEVTIWPTHRPIRGTGQPLSRTSQTKTAPALTSLAREPARVARSYVCAHPPRVSELIRSRTRAGQTAWVGSTRGRLLGGSPPPCPLPVGQGWLVAPGRGTICAHRDRGWPGLSIASAPRIGRRQSDIVRPDQRLLQVSRADLHVCVRLNSREPRFVRW